MQRKSLVAPEARVVRIVVASPGDVQKEREAVEAIANELNRDLAADKNMMLRVIRWETDASPGFHPRGPQALIDSVLKIADCDLLIGIFWKRFGTPVLGAGSGTEHEIMQAYQSWRKQGKPQIFVYFNEKSFEPVTKEEKDQSKRVQEFKRKFPSEGLWWKYSGARNLEALIRTHLTRWILHEAPTSRTLTASKRRSTVQGGHGKRRPSTKASPKPKSFSRIKLATLTKRMVMLIEEYEVTNNQLLMTLNEADRLRLKRQLQKLESEIREVEREIADLEKES